MRRHCAYCGGRLHSYERETHPDFPGLEFCDEPCMCYYVVMSANEKVFAGHAKAWD